MAWWQVVLVVASLAIAYVNRPRPEDSKPATLEEIQVPTADERPIAVLFGTRDFKAPNVVYYGNLRNTPVFQRGQPFSEIGWSPCRNWPGAPEQ